MKVFVTTISFNNSKATSECLESLEKIKKDNIDLTIVVIDNASKEKFETENKYKNFKLHLIRSEKNLGFSGGQNLGIKYALSRGADYLVILNNDVIVDENFLLELISSFRDNIGIVVPKIYFAKGYEFHKDRYRDSELGKVIWYAGGILDLKNVIGSHKGVDEVDTGQFDRAEETDNATGCCMAVKREIFEKLGMLDENYFLYYEDSDFNLRTKKAGYKILYQPKAIIWHKNAGSSGGSGSPLQDYYITRNRMIFGMRYAPLRARIALIHESLTILRTGRHWQKKGIVDFYKGNLGKGSFAL